MNQPIDDIHEGETWDPTSDIPWTPEPLYLRTGVTKPVGISLKYVPAYVFPMQPAARLPNISVRFSNIKNLNLKIYSSQMWDFVKKQKQKQNCLRTSREDISVPSEKF